MTPAGTPAFLRDGSVPVREHTYSPVELFLFSAATWNPHRVHYDQDYVREVAGRPDLLVHGPLQAAHMFELLTQALADGVRMRALEYRHVAALHVGEPVRMSGQLLSVERSTASVQMWVAAADSGRRTTIGVAYLERLEADAVTASSPAAAGHG